MLYVIVCNKTKHGAAIVSDSARIPKIFPDKESAMAWIADNPDFKHCEPKPQDKIWK